MYIGKFEIYKYNTDKTITVPIFFKRPSFNEVNNILSKYNCPKITLDSYKILYEDNRCIHSGYSINELCSIYFIRKGLKC